MIAPSDPRSRLAGLLRKVRRVATNRDGASAVIVGLSLTALVGGAGIATEAGLWYATDRQMQGAADSAAVSAAVAYGSGDTATSDYTAQAQAVAASDGFTNGAGGVTVTVNRPPTSGNYTTTQKAIQVVIAQPQTRLFSQLFLAKNPTISVAAVAIAGASGNGCVLALDTGNVVGVSESGGASIGLNNCSLYVNSPSSDALTMSGGASIDALSAFISGGVDTSGGASLKTTDGTNLGTAPTPDPYANVQIPPFSGCNQTNYSLSGGKTQTIDATGTTPYVFCNGLSLSGGASLTLGPGIYVIDRGSFSISGGTKLNATGGVTIIFTSSTGSNYATANISGGATVNITAPSSGPTAGLAFFQSRSAPSTGSDSFSGGASQNITGAIYFPNQNVNYSGGTQTGSSTQCTQLVALTITYSGGASFGNNNCPTGVANIGAAATQLVE
jgi:Flp pilus assembly protein TadG